MGKTAKKGGEFERQISKMLSLWWTDGKRDDIFWRTAGSGARRTTRAKVGDDTANSAGDLAFLDAEGAPFVRKFLVELKRGYSKDFDILDLLDKPVFKVRPWLYEVWDKAEAERQAAGREFVMLIIQRNRRLPVVVVGSEFCAKFWDGVDRLEKRGKLLSVRDPRGLRLSLYLFEDFFDVFTREDFCGC